MNFPIITVMYRAIYQAYQCVAYSRRKGGGIAGGRECDKLSVRGKGELQTHRSTPTSVSALIPCITLVARGDSEGKTSRRKQQGLLSECTRGGSRYLSGDSRIQRRNDTFQQRIVKCVGKQFLACDSFVGDLVISFRAYGSRKMKLNVLKQREKDLRV